MNSAPAPTISGGWGTNYKVAGKAPDQMIEGGKLPIGAVATFSLVPPSNGRKYDYKSIIWSNGSDDKSYYSGGSGNTAPNIESVKTGVATNQSNYSFIVVPAEQEYNVMVSVCYLKPDGTDTAPGVSKVTFTAVAPTVSFNTTQGKATPNLVQYRNTPQDPPQEYVQLELFGNPNGTTDLDKAGMRIDAKTTTKDFRGAFMFLQIIRPVRSAQYDGGNFWWPSNDARGNPASGAPAVDNTFYYPNAPAVGYPVYQRQKKSGGFGWFLQPSQTLTRTMIDSPYAQVPRDGLKSLSVGDPATNTTEKFDTYVMYRPGVTGSPSVWIAIGKVHWEWGGSTSDGKTLGPAPNVPAPQQTVPVGPSEYFPSWSDSGSQMLGRSGVLAGSPGWLPQ